MAEGGGACGAIWQEVLSAIAFGGMYPCRLIHAKDNNFRLIRRERKRT
jgi:hypothetical protein